MLENQLITDDEFFHWLSPVFCLIVVLFADLSDLAFCWINESACGLVLEVVFMIFKGYECLPLCHTFCTVVDVEVSSNVFGFVVNVSDGIIVQKLSARNNGYSQRYLKIQNNTQ